MILDKFHLIKNGVDTELEIVDTAGRTALSDLKASLAPVATSGDYDDLINKPSLAAVATSGDYDDLINKPSLATVATSGDYDDLIDKPSLATVATSGDYDDLIDKPTIPTNVSQLNNDSGFITASSLPIAFQQVLPLVTDVAYGPIYWRDVTITCPTGVNPVGKTCTITAECGIGLIGCTIVSRTSSTLVVRCSNPTNQNLGNVTFNVILI